MILYSQDEHAVSRRDAVWLNSLLPFGFKHQRGWMGQLQAFREAGGTARGYSNSGSLAARAIRVHEDPAGPKAYHEC